MSEAASGTTTDPREVPQTGPPADADDLERSVWSALDDVIDLHIPFSLVKMGMIYGVSVEDGDVTVEMTFPCMGCPGYEMLQGDVENRVSSVPGVEDVTVEVVWEPIWTKDMIDEKVQEEIQEYGIGL